ncbi:tetratricopeptide repeat protein [Halioxenophilus aromaticivorans]|uniref:Tetratricopeptide repeat protein n=1 Tax=Halioxenophilus aromaticivorans TaxID=1306992 RepID=A0AAV3U7T2_9ALTE
MSLLLEALKKAALEKQEKNQLTSGNTALQTEEFKPEDLQLADSLGELSPEFEAAKQSVEESLNKAEGFTQRLTLAAQATQGTTRALSDTPQLDIDINHSESSLSLDPTEFEILEDLPQNTQTDVCEQSIGSELTSIAIEQHKFTVSEGELEGNVETEQESKQENTQFQVTQTDRKFEPNQDDAAQTVGGDSTDQDALAAVDDLERAGDAVEKPLPDHQDEFGNLDGVNPDPRQEKLARILQLTEHAETKRRQKKWLLSAAVVCALSGSVAYYSLERYKEISTSVLTPQLAIDSAAQNQNNESLVKPEITEPTQLKQQDVTFQESTVLESTRRESTQQESAHQQTNVQTAVVAEGDRPAIKQNTGKISHSLFDDRAPKRPATKAPAGAYQAHLARHHGIQLSATAVATSTQFNSKKSFTAAKDSTAISTVNLPASNAPQQTLADTISAGYLAWQQGNWTKAEQAYDYVLERAPTSRDALLGAAAVAQELGKEAKSLAYYQRRLEIAPKDEYALAGLLNLANVGVVNHRFESELNNLIAEYPSAAHLHFLKGSLYASKQQWYPSQQAFFNAWKLDGKNPDYAFNLAVSMDHLDLPSEALVYYRTAYELAQHNRHNFDTNHVQQRIEQLIELR